jgi:hypothetical protein
MQDLACPSYSVWDLWFPNQKMFLKGSSITEKNLSTGDAWGSKMCGCICWQEFHHSMRAAASGGIQQIPIIKATDDVHSTGAGCRKGWLLSVLVSGNVVHLANGPSGWLKLSVSDLLVH